MRVFIRVLFFFISVSLIALFHNTAGIAIVASNPYQNLAPVSALIEFAILTLFCFVIPKAIIKAYDKKHPREK